MGAGIGSPILNLLGLYIPAVGDLGEFLVCRPRDWENVSRADAAPHRICITF